MRLSTSFINQLGVNRILDQQSQIATLQQQISTGTRILTAADDPVGAAQVLRLTEEININNQYQRNADNAINRLSLEESVLENIEESLIRVRELTIQGSNATLSNSDRRAIATEIQERFNEVLGLANTRDANREFLFSGFQSLTQPFIENPDGTIQYNGDQGSRELQISTGRTIADSHNGLDVFGNILNGNGTFQVADSNANTGTGIITVGQVTDTAAYVADTYTINFVTNAAGNVAYNVIGASSGQIIPALPQDATNDAPDYVSGAAINFNGVEISISEEALAGDTFTVSPSQRQDIFSTLNNLVGALQSSSANPSEQANRSNALSTTLQDLDQAFENILRIRTDIGARLRTIEDQVITNDDFILELQTIRSQTSDVDVTAAISELTSRISTLEAAQATFVRVQNLSLFNQL